MTGWPGSTWWLAVPALLLALLVPARAIALCCFAVVGPAAPAGAHANHGPTPHHRPDGEPARVGPGLGPAAVSACVGLTTPAPALRERGPSVDAAPGAGDPAIAPVVRVRDFGLLRRQAPLPMAPVSHSVGVESLHPLRL